MITVRAPTGDKAADMVTVRTPTGDKAVARMTLRTPSGDSIIFDATGGGGGGAGGDLTVSVSPLTATGSTFDAMAETVTTNSVTVTVSGGTPPYSIAWTALGGIGAWTILSPASLSTRFRAVAPSPGDTDNNSFVGTITDARGREGEVTVPAIVYNFATGGL